MSTHCGIAIKTEEGYSTIYCHHDGMPSYMLPMLTENHNSEESAAKIVSLGDASFIEKAIEPTTDSHTFDKPERGVCVFYHRDRGEPWDDTAPEINTKESLLNYFWYAYIWENGCWNAYKGGKLVK